MLVEVYRDIMKDDRAPEDPSENITILLSKGKGDAPSCEKKYRGLRLLEHCIKVWNGY